MENLGNLNPIAFDRLCLMPTLGFLTFCSYEGQNICVYDQNPENLDTEKGCCKKKGWCLLCSAVLPTTASKMYSLYMSYESTASLFQATSIATALWSLLDALSSNPATLTGSEETLTMGAGVPATCTGPWEAGSKHRSHRRHFPLQRHFHTSELTAVISSFSWYQQERR